MGKIKSINRSLGVSICPLFKAISVSAMNQIVTSGTNFILGLFLIRILTVSEFGVYGILQSASFVIAGLGNSLFISQMVVHYPDKELESRAEYVSSILYLITISGSIFFLLSAMIFIVLMFAFNIDFKLFALVSSVIIFSIGYLLKEFFCRIAYSQRREVRALRINVTISLSLLVIVIAIQFLNIPISAHKILYCYSISAFIGAAIGQIEAQLPLKPHWGKMYNSVKEVWGGGKWALASDILNSCRQQAHVFITAAFAGTTGVAMINAAKLFLTPVMLLTPSFSQLYIARLVTLRQSEPLKLLRNGILFSTANVVCVLIYGMALILSFHHISPLVLSDGFPRIDSFVAAWFFVSLFSAGRYGLETTQKAMKHFKSLTIVNIPVSMVALVSVYLLLITIGPVGSIYGLAIAEFILALILAKLVYLSAKEIQSSKA
jgi:O-antigen/teichoic acid export membrane protein